jgi:molybdopterin converting factor small subunit
MALLMRVPVSFYSYFKDLTGCSEAVEEVEAGGTIEDLLQKLFARFPRLSEMKRSMLVAVGVEYQGRSYVLQPGDQVSLFPPVQGG